LKRLLKISKLTCRVLLLLTIFFLGVLFSDQAKAQVLPNFGPVWNRLMVTSRSFRPATDLDWPGKKDNWWVLTISNDKLTTSNIAGFVTLTFDRAWVELPTTKPKDPLAGNNYSLNIVLDLHYNSISRKTYSFGLGGDEIIGGGNETKPGYFFIALPRSMILSFPLKPTATMNNCVSIITSAIQRDESWPNVGLYSKPIGDEIPFWKVSTTALPDFSGLFQPIK
jgi:hypothetical protein